MPIIFQIGIINGAGAVVSWITFKQGPMVPICACACHNACHIDKVNGPGNEHKFDFYRAEQSTNLMGPHLQVESWRSLPRRVNLVGLAIHEYQRLPQARCTLWKERQGEHTSEPIDCAVDGALDAHREGLRCLCVPEVEQCVWARAHAVERGA